MCYSMDAIARAIQKRGSGMNWKLCSEELPKNTGNYLITVSTDPANKKERAVRISLYSSKLNQFLYGNAIAWKPLDKPYMEDLND